MTANFILTFLRGLLSRKLYSLLNIFGLGISLSVCVVIAMFVQHEFGMDRHFANSDRIYLIWQIPPKFMGVPSYAKGSNSNLGPLLQANFPEVEAQTRLSMIADPVMLQQGQVRVKEAGLRYASEDFFRIFDFAFVHGDAKTALDRPDSLVLTRELAQSLFGSVDVLGKSVTVDGKHEMRVSAVIEKPVNTHLSFTALGPISVYDQKMNRPIPLPGGRVMPSMNPSSYTYALLRENTSIATVASQLQDLAKSQSRSPLPVEYAEQALTSIYPGLIFQGASGSFNNLQRAQLFAAIGLCILLIAVVNFMNLATADGTCRAREVGVKVAMGAGRGKLIRQFLGESLLMVAAAMLVALVLAELMLPLVNTVMKWDLAFSQIAPAVLVPVLLASVLLLGLVAGSYPAFYLTAWQPAKVLRGELTRGRSGLWFRSALVVLQFTISIALIITAVVMYRQLQFTQNFDHGFDPHQVVTMPMPDGAVQATQLETTISRLQDIPGVVEVTHSQASPMMEIKTVSMAMNPDRSKDDIKTVVVASADNFLSFYRFHLLAGRYPGTTELNDKLASKSPTGKAMPSDGMVLNATAARQFGWTPQQALDQPLDVGPIHGKIIGVVQDSIASTRAEPLAIVYLQSTKINFNSLPARISVRLADNATAATLAELLSTWQQIFPGDTDRHISLSDFITAQLRDDRLIMGFFAWSAALAVLIACFGLFGLATFNTERRTKEIGVRKVMGSSVTGIVVLLTQDFSKLVLLSNLIAWPLAYFAISRWLEGFAYRISLSPLIFVGSGLIALCIAGVTVGGTAARAASAKPVLALRYE